MFNSLRPHHLKATIIATTPSKQSPRLCHSYNMIHCSGNLYLVNPISNFRISVQGIWCHVWRMYGSVKYGNAPHILNILYQHHRHLKLSPMLRKQLVETNSRCWELYHWIRCPIIALHNYFLWLGFVASVAKSQLTFNILTPKNKVLQILLMLQWR